MGPSFPGSRRRSSFPKEFALVGETEDGEPIFEDAGADDDLDLLYPGTPDLSDREEDRHVAGIEPYGNSSSDELCDFCREIPFHQLGFLSGGDYLYKRWSHPKRVIADLFGAHSCRLCQSLRDIILEFRAQQSAWAANPQREVWYSIDKVGEWAPVGDQDDYHQSHLFRLGISFEDNGGARRPRVTFQKCSEPAFTVAHFCQAEDPESWIAPGAEPCEGRLRPLEVDIRLVKKWEATCSSRHGAGLFSGPPPTDLRFIDVQKGCIVEDVGQVDYVALSYVWGKAELPCLTSKTEEKYRTPSALTSDNLPPTFGDAIEVTQQLGFNYIWIDCLCIIQDSSDDKARYIPQMDSVYGYAALTIVAGSGSDVWTGLPGVRPGSRIFEQRPFSARGINLMQTLDPCGPTLTVAAEGGYAEETTWASRAWTFQEKLFSSRCLIFTERQVFWACQKASWCEDSIWELHDGPTAYRWALQTDRTRLPWTDNQEQFRQLYSDLVSSFNRRNLTFEPDSLNAFSGIIRSLERASSQDFFWGLPTGALERALDWQGTNLSSFRRRFDGRKKELVQFPTWCWAAWVGVIVPTGFIHIQEGSMADEKDAILGLAFYRVKNGVIEELPQPRQFQSEAIAKYLEHDARLESKIEAVDLPANSVSNPIVERLLCFWTDTVRVSHNSTQERNSGDRFPASSRDYNLRYEPTSDGTSLNVNGSFDFPKGTDYAELIVIARRLKLPEELVVLYVTWEQGIAYRRGSLTVLKSDWVRLERLWQPVVLA